MLMNIVISCACVALFVIFCIYSKREAAKIESVDDFLSFGPDPTPEKLGRTFLASNASFTTAFLSLFLFSGYYGQLAFAIPIGFCVGIFVYVRFFLPRKINALVNNRLYPALVAEAADSQSLKKFLSIFVVFSLWLFTFAELQGFSSIAQSFAPIPSGVWISIIPILLVVSIAYYSLNGGYRAVIKTDRLQLRIIEAGVTAIVILAAVHIANNGWHQFFLTISSIQGYFGSWYEVLLFCVETLVGFLFSQLLYYDNWQRLGAYFRSSIKHRFDGIASNENCDKLIKEIQKSYRERALYLLIIYAIPILFGYSILASGGELSSGGLFQGLQNASQSIPIPFAGEILLIASILMMASALMSTMDTYTLGATHALIKGVFPSLFDQQSIKKEQGLDLARTFTGIFILALIPVLLIEPKWESLFLYLFYSANGFVGPILFAVLGYRLNALACKITILIGLIYPAIFYLIPDIENYLHSPFINLLSPGIVPVVLSLLIVGTTSSKPNKEKNDAG